MALGTTMSSETTETNNVATWKQVLGYLGGAFLGGILLLGAYTKVLDPLAFHETIRSEGLDFLLPASVGRDDRLRPRGRPRHGADTRRAPALGVDSLGRPGGVLSLPDRTCLLPLCQRNHR